MHFIYFLPFSDQEALIESTLFSPELAPADFYDEAIISYLKRICHLSAFEISRRESGVIAGCWADMIQGLLVLAQMVGQLDRQAAMRLVLFKSKLTMPCQMLWPASLWPLGYRTAPLNYGWIVFFSVLRVNRNWHQIFLPRWRRR